MPVNPAKQTIERIVEEELVRRVRAAGGIAEKTTVIGRRGFFDRVVVLPGGKVIFCECKRPKGGRLSPHQIERIRQYRQLGAVVAVISNSADIDRLLLLS
jgi:hypothetical protein